MSFKHTLSHLKIIRLLTGIPTSADGIYSYGLSRIQPKPNKGYNMHKVSVDLFFCKRDNVKKAIQGYLQEISNLGGMICPSYIYLWDVPVSTIPDDLPNVFRIFSIQRRKMTDEVRIVVNVSRYGKGG